MFSKLGADAYTRQLAKHKPGFELEKQAQRNDQAHFRCPNTRTGLRLRSRRMPHRPICILPHPIMLVKGE